MKDLGDIKSVGQIESHHYVPQCYLKGFTIPDKSNNKMIWVYDKRYTNARPSRQPKSIKSVACENNYYATENEDGSTSLQLEKKQFKMIDDIFAKLLVKISQATTDNASLTLEEKGHFAFCIALLFTRVPSFRDPITDIYKRVAEELVHNNKDKLPPPPLGKNFEDLIVEIKPWKSLEAMVELASSLSFDILSKPWLFHKLSGGDFFIANDNPVLIQGSNSVISPLNEIVLPINKGVCFVASPHNGFSDQKIIKAAPGFAQKVNEHTAFRARHRIFSHHNSQYIRQLTQKSANTEQTLSPPHRHKTSA